MYSHQILIGAYGITEFQGLLYNYVNYIKSSAEIKIFVFSEKINIPF